MLAGPAMAIPPATYIERELKSKEEHEAGVAAPQPAHTAPSPPRRERKPRERASERATDRPTDLFSTDRFLASTAALNTFNGSWRIPPISLSLRPTRPPSPSPLSLAELPTNRGTRRSRERGRAQRADRMSLRFAFFDLLLHAAPPSCSTRVPTTDLAHSSYSLFQFFFLVRDIRATSSIEHRRSPIRGGRGGGRKEGSRAPLVSPIRSRL